MAEGDGDYRSMAIAGSNVYVLGHGGRGLRGSTPSGGFTSLQSDLARSAALITFRVLLAVALGVTLGKFPVRGLIWDSAERPTLVALRGWRENGVESRRGSLPKHRPPAGVPAEASPRRPPSTLPTSPASFGAAASKPAAPPGS